MQEQSVPVRAAIDIGSNTIHIVVARCFTDDLDILADEEELVRIGESVTATGEISPQKRDAAIATLLRYKALAEHYQAAPILVVATEAIRRARNREEFLADVLQGTGLVVQIIEGELEATVTFYGTTYQLRKEPDVPLLTGIMDLGGGSTELVLARGTDIFWRTSVPIGSGWLHDRYLPADPPTPEDVEIAHAFLQTYFEGLHITPCPPALIATGGSANSLLRLANTAFGVDTANGKLTYDDILRCEEILQTMTAEEVSQRYGQQLARTLVMPAGALIIHTIMELFRLNEIRVTSHGIREGVLLAYARYGEQWLHLDMHGTGAVDSINIDVEDELPGNCGSFVYIGRRMLQERTRKMLDWREEVLKHEDVEAVHKMRVATRRLRAVLDAYQSICQPKPFERVYRRVKELADLLGKARDSDVMIEHLRAKLEQLPAEDHAGVQWLIDRLQTYRQRQQKTLETYLKRLDENVLWTWIAACLPEGGVSDDQSQARRWS